MALNLNDGTNPPTPAETDARSDIAKLQAKLEDLQYDYDRRNEDCVRVREALVPLLRQNQMADESVTRDVTPPVRAGYVAKVAADVLRSQQVQIEHLTARRQVELDELKAKCGQQADMLARHCQRRDEVERMANSLDPTSGYGRINTFKSDLLRILGGAR